MFFSVSTLSIPRSVILSGLVFMSLSAEGQMGGGEYGKVNMRGSVVASACNIALESMDQHIDLGSLPINIVARDGQGPEHNFRLRLEDCELFRPGTWDFSSVRVTFDGPRDDVRHLIRLSGDAKGVGLLIKDNDGRTIIPGEAISSLPLKNGSVELDYKLAVEKNNDELFAGNYRTGVRFKVEYE